MKEKLELILTDLTLVEGQAERFNFPPEFVADLRAARALVIRARNRIMKVAELSEPAWPDTMRDREAWEEAKRRLKEMYPCEVTFTDSMIADLAQKIKKETL